MGQSSSRRWARRWVPALLTAVAVCTAAAPTSGAPAVAATTSGSAWTVYHGDPAGDGVAAGVSSVRLSSAAWTSPTLDGQLYGEPLASGGQVFVATENDTVYALSATNGTVVWSTHLGPPVPAGSLPCGDISPTVGVTGTPVIDPARSEIFVVADELVHGTPAHVLVGLDTSSGKTELSQVVDPAGSDPAALLQRTGLTLDGGRVVFGFGGNFGDCSSYHGWVIAVPEAGGSPSAFEVDSGPGEDQGAVWMGGAAPVVDSSGNVWVEAGNGSVTSSSHTYDDSDSVLELSPALGLLQYFAPASWASENATDLDLSTAPALLPDGQVVGAGKDRTAYLLDASRLGSIGGELSSVPGACSDVIDGGVAFVGTTVYLPCLSGTVALQASSSPPRLRLLWSSTSGGGPPIVAGGLVWTIGQDGTLYGLNPTTGTVRQQAEVGTPANHFPTASVGAGLLLVPTATRVVAFGTTSPAPAPATTTTTSVPPPTTRVRSASGPTPSGGSGIPAWAIAVIVVGALALAAGTVWLLRRRGRPAPRST